MPSSKDDLLASLNNSQAWRFAGLVQDRLTRPVGEKIIANPADGAPGSPDCGICTFIAPDGTHIRAVNGIERPCETWIDVSKDGGITWQRAATLTKEDETISFIALASVEHPYIYGKMVKGEPRLVLGMSASEKDTKCWDIREREAPLADPAQLKETPLRVVLSGNAEYAYKDGVPIRSPDGKGVYFAATRHYISGRPETGVNADTVLCRLDEASGRYEVLDTFIPLYARGGLDKTCNRITSEVAFPDGSRFWGCDVRNVEPHNAAAARPLKPGDAQNWALGNFDEITSCAIGTWVAGNALPAVASVNAVLGWSSHPRYPALRYLGIALLMPLDQLMPLLGKGDEAAALLTYERADATGTKIIFQQSLSRKDLAMALAGNGPQLILGQDPIEEVRQRRRS